MASFFRMFMIAGLAPLQDAGATPEQWTTVYQDIEADSSDVTSLLQRSVYGQGDGHLGVETAPAQTSAGGFGIAMAVVLGCALGLFTMEKCAKSIEAKAALIAEFVGTFALVFTVGCCVITGDGLWNATAIACVLMVMVYATGPISGGHLNPAVTLTLAMTGKFDWASVPAYCFTQIVAGITAGSCYAPLFSPQSVNVAPVAPFTAMDAFAVEAIYTFMLCFVVLNCAASKRNNAPEDGNQFFALAIGFVIVAGGYAAGGISGAAFNPAVALGLDLSSSDQGIGWGFVWSLYEVVGAVAAAKMFQLVRPEDFKEADDGADATLPVKLVSEFLGVFMLVLTVGLNLATGSAMTAWSAAAALMCMIYSLGDVSGAHFNPAVTVSVFLRGKCPVMELATFVPVQLFAGATAGAISALIHKHGPKKMDAIFLQPGESHGLLAASMVEFVFTFVLCYVVLCTATIQKPVSQLTKQNFYFGLAIGMSVTAGGFASGSISGGELNPAVSTGIALGSGLYSPEGAAVSGSMVGNLLMLAGGELAGGIFAALLFNVTHPEEMGKSATMLSKCACEFVGVFVLVFTVVCNILGKTGTMAATSIACSLMAMIYAVGPVSGGHLNPAVTLTLVLSKKAEAATLPGYWAAQLAGGLAAGFAGCAFFKPAVANVAPVSPFTSTFAFLAEAIYTFMLCFVVLNAAASRRNNPAKDGNNFFGLAIGFVIVAGGYAVGNVSGAAFNPAVALGLDLSSYSEGVGWGFAWAAFELLGAAIAAIMFRIVRPEDFLSTEEEAEGYEPALVTKLASEFLGVFMLVLTVGLNLSTGSTTTAWSAAAALMCMIYALGNVSGAHFNPAVTLACVASGRGLCSALEGVAYVTVQLLAGAAAGMTYALFHSAGPKNKAAIALDAGATYTLDQAAIVELAATALLSYIVLSCATVTPAGSPKTKNSFYFALCIGSCVTVGGFGIGAVSGGELNPAVSTGILVGSEYFSPKGAAAAPFANLVKLAVWELAGGLVGATVFQMTHAREYLAAEKA
eukprot:TRINITY_DN10715_c0_g1_i3.p1 TRINITY_DN10715_c0_g1~~TRINITY_DN10715_c0_g1_i3.p1  ORF type:complete len:1024 (-),score=232.19 TRINITY_DN10715_c0_g1_i3:62-3133(-)